MLQGAIFGGFLGWYIIHTFEKVIDNNVTQEAAQLIAALVFSVGGALLGYCYKRSMLFLFGVAMGVQLASIINVVIITRKCLR
jgi:uncharacterized membrane protein YjjB (DUF3815 family)